MKRKKLSKLVVMTKASLRLRAEGKLPDYRMLIDTITAINKNPLKDLRPTNT